VEEIAALARSAGATTRLGEEVRDVLVEGGRVRGLRTDEREVECRRVVVAAGPWTRPLLAELGIALPLKVVRPLQGFLRMPATALEPIEAEDDESPPADARLRVSSGDFSRRPAAHAVLLDLEHGYYARCEPEAERTRVGGMDYGSCEELDDPDDLDESVDPAFRRWARGALERRMPVYQRLGDAGAEAAWYTLSPDSQALIGPAGRFEGLWVVSGFSGHGFKLAPSVGEGVAQMVLGRPVSAFDPAFFDPARFAGAAPRRAGAFGL
jgi:glycine/D-amino acid oxidase-like deaminating enzyme